MKWNQIIIAFVLGAFVSAGVIHWCGGRNRSWHGGRHDKLVEKFSRELKLTADQKKKVADILAAKREKIDMLRKDVKPRFEQIRKATQAEIRRVLTPEQQVKYDKMVSEREERWKKEKHWRDRD